MKRSSEEVLKERYSQGSWDYHREIGFIFAVSTFTSVRVTKTLLSFVPFESGGSGGGVVLLILNFVNFYTVI